MPPPKSLTKVSKQTRLEFQGRLSFTQEENKLDFEDILTESREQTKKKKAQISSV